MDRFYILGVHLRFSHQLQGPYCMFFLIMEDYNTIYEYISGKNIKYPDRFSKAQKRIFRKRAAKCSIIDV